MSESIARPPAMIRLRYWFWPAALIILVTDLWSKAAIFAVPRPEGADLRTTLFFLQQHYADSAWIRPSYNPGVAWSMFDSYPDQVALVTVLLIPLLCWLFWRWFRSGSRLEVLAFGAVLGGAFGNAYDRLLALADRNAIFGVRDFIHVDLGFPPFDPWPTFNIADVGITCGFLVLMASSLLRGSGQTDGSQAPAAPGGDADSKHHRQSVPIDEDKLST